MARRVGGLLLQDRAGIHVDDDGRRNRGRPCLFLGGQSLAGGRKGGGNNQRERKQRAA